MSQPSAFARRIVSSAVLAATLGLSGCFGLAVTGAAIGTVAVVTSNASLRRIDVTSKTVATNAHTVPQVKRKPALLSVTR